jgi:AcrR family transcriptional regulator
VDAVLEAAARVLTSQGYGAATTNHIARVAGVSIGTVYEYFSNREEIFDALIQREVDALVVAFGTVQPDPEQPLLPQLSQLLRAGMRAMRHGPELFRSLEHASEAVFQAHLTRARSQVVGFIRQLLEEHRDELRVRDLDLAAFVAVTAVEGVAAAASNERFDERLLAELEDLLRTYLTGAP